MKFLYTTIAIFSAGLAVNAMPATLNRRQSLATVVTSCTVPDTAALTFDDGPNEYLYDISEALVAAGGVGTFFFNGNNYGCIYSDENVERVKYAYANGHQVASHTWSHRDLATLSSDDVDNELFLVDQALMRILGVRPAFMRPPYGSYNDAVRQVAQKRGQTLVLWDFDSGDSVGATPEQSNQAYDDLANERPSTILALNHESYETTAHQVLPHAIEVLQAQGYKLVTLAECLGEDPYQTIQEPEEGSWTC